MGRVAGHGEDHGIGIDTGCQYAPSCLACPWPVCKDDDPGWFARNAAAVRDRKMRTVIEAEGLSVRQAAERFGVSERQIYLIRRREKDR